MNKVDLKYLLDLQGRIKRGCEILEVSRMEDFMPKLTFFFEAVSLGITQSQELGITPASPKTAKVKGGSTVVKKKRVMTPPDKDRVHRATQAAYEVMKKHGGEMKMVEITEGVQKHIGNLKHPQQFVWQVLQRLKSEKVIEAVPKKRGFYRVRKTNGKIAKSKAASKPATEASASTASN